MIVVYLIFLAVIQAVTEFLPVSSLGHLCILEQYMGIGHETGLLSETMLHLGSAAAIIFLFRKDLKKIGLGLLGMFMDIIGNLNLYIHNKKTGESLGYARIVTVGVEDGIGVTEGVGVSVSAGVPSGVEVTVGVGDSSDAITFSESEAAGKVFSVSVMHESSSPELKISSKLSGVPNSAACTGTVAVISATVRNTLARRFPLLCLFLYIFTSILQKRPNIKYAGRSLCIPNHSKTSSDCPAFDQNRHNLLICK